MNFDGAFPLSLFIGQSLISLASLSIGLSFPFSVFSSASRPDRRTEHGVAAFYFNLSLHSVRCEHVAPPRSGSLLLGFGARNNYLTD